MMNTKKQKEEKAPVPMKGEGVKCVDVVVVLVVATSVADMEDSGCAWPECKNGQERHKPSDWGSALVIKVK